MYKKAVEIGLCVARGPFGGTWRGDFFSGDFERQVIIWRAPPLGTPTRVVKEGFGKGLNEGTWRGSPIPGNLRDR
jgi:hypothetical protein